MRNGIICLSNGTARIRGWKTELPGSWSSPIVVGSTLVLTNAIEEDDRLPLEVLALDSARNEIVGLHLFEYRVLLVFTKRQSC